MNTSIRVHSSGSPFAVATHDLSKRYGPEFALAGVDLRVPAGAVYVLIGRNGAGKTTAFRVLMNLVRPDSGTAEVFGMDTGRRGPEVRAQIGYVPERAEHGYRWMTVRRLLEHHAAFFPTWDRAYAGRLAGAFGLGLNRKVGAISKGVARQLQLVLALAHRPPLLLLDEPLDGLDAVVRDEMLALLAAHIADTPTTVLVSTHRVHDVERLADHVGVLRRGRLVAQLSGDELRRTVRRYRAEVPEGWRAPPDLERAPVRRSPAGREIEWTISGEEREVTDRLTRAGAHVREVASLTLEDAALALLREEVSP